jgi:hypothetical protein
LSEPSLHENGFTEDFLPSFTASFKNLDLDSNIVDALGKPIKFVAPARAERRKLQPNPVDGVQDARLCGAILLVSISLRMLSYSRCEKAASSSIVMLSQ